MRLKRKFEKTAEKLYSWIRENRPAIVPGTILIDNGDYSYDVLIKGKVTPRVGCCLSFDGLFGELVGTEVYVFMDSDPMIVGVRYPETTIEEGLEGLRRVYGIE